MSVAASLLERGAPESTGGGDGACDEVQAVQAERSAEMCTTSAPSKSVNHRRCQLPSATETGPLLDWPAALLTM